MTVKNIIRQVRWCVDEEHGSNGDYEDTYFDNIVKAKIGASLRWCALYADAILLTDGKGTEGDSLATDYTLKATKDATSTPLGIKYLGDGYVQLSPETIRVSRVKADGWKKGINVLIEEDTDEYLMQSDETAQATQERPVVALIRTNPLKVQLFPEPEMDSDIELSVISVPTDPYLSDDEDGSTDIDVPVKMQTAFVYYLAYLVMSAHNDVTKANTMLGIAKQQIAISTEQ